MKINSKIVQKFKDALYQEGLRFTEQRLCILEDILNSEDHRDCDQIYNSLKKKRDTFPAFLTQH